MATNRRSISDTGIARAGSEPDLERLLADRTRRMGASAIRELLKVVAQPGMISLAGGIPAPESFPIEIMDELTSLVLKKYSSSALQYGPSEGCTPLREALVEFVAQKGIQASLDNLIITSGSQGVLEAIGKILISKGDRVAVESPTYVGAISAFNPYEPEYVELETDDDGVIPEALEETLKQAPVKFVYVIPTFQNPTGKTIPLDRREQIADIIIRYGTLLLEDDPYSALRFRGDHLPSIKTLAPNHVVYTSTFSKVLAPGLRIGYCVAPELIKKWMVLAKQGIDLHTSSFDQALALEYLSGGYLERQIPKIIALYKPRQEAMVAALDNYFPEGFKWTRPDGGMFLWVEGPSNLDTSELYDKAARNNVVFVSGKYFYATPGKGLPTMRLNFTMVDEETIEKAIRILSEVIKQDD